jgi:hypothetical protein
MASLNRTALDALPDGATVFAVVVFTEDAGGVYLMHGGRTELAISVGDGGKGFALRPDNTGACFDFEHLDGNNFEQGDNWRATFYDDAASAHADFESEIMRGALISGPGWSTEFLS